MRVGVPINSQPGLVTQHGGSMSLTHDSRMLIFDANQPRLDVLGQSFSQLNFRRVVYTTTPECSKQMLLDHTFDCVVARGKEGIHFLSTVRTGNCQRDIPFVCIVDQSDIVQKVLGKGASGVIVDPFQFHELTNRLQEVLVD